MAAPFKRFCCQAARQTRQPFAQRQWQPSPVRPFSSTSTARANPHHAGEENQFLTPFPSDSQDAQLDPVYEEDDISSLGHAELEQHRELREMVRVAAWEMPRLGDLHKAFHPPDRTQLPLRWRYTTYMGEQHPASRKVVVEFQPRDLRDLTPPQREKLLKLAGPRYNPTTGVVKMSCESFETQAQNKRFLGDTISKLLAEARDPDADAFADVPLDTRHVKTKPRPRFPTSWLLTAERKAELEARRRQQLLEEGQKVEQNRLVSGVGAIEEQRQIDAKRVEEPVMAEARQPLQRRKMGRKEMGQQRVQR